MQEQFGMGLLLVWTWVKEKIMPLGAFKAGLMGASGSAVTGDVVLLSSQTASDSATIDFTSGITSTYGEYIFRFYNINPATDEQNFTFQANAAGASGFNETITSTVFHAGHKEDDSYTNLSYLTAEDQAQGTAYQMISRDIGNSGDESGAGELHLFNPSSTTYTKHWYSMANGVNAGLDPHYSSANYCGGYINTTTAIDEISFKMESGNFDGKIKMWGVL
jgi:hypothetical protein